MQFTQTPPDYAPFGAPLRYAFSDTEPARTFDVQVYDYGVGDVIGARRMFESQGGQIDIAPFLRHRLRFQPAVAPTGFYDAPDRSLIVDVVADGVRSPIRTLLPRREAVEAPALLSSMPVKRLIARGECDELTLLTSQSCVASVSWFCNGETSSRNFTSTDSGLRLFRLNMNEFPDAERISVLFDRFVQVSWEVVESRPDGCRVAWRSDAGAVEHYDFPVVREERLETVDRMIRNVWGEPAAETRAVRVLNLLSAYETVDTLRALAGMLHAPQVWIVDPENGYQPVVVASNSAGIRRHGSLCNLEVELHCPVA